jgi:hypothetical protein
MSPYLSQKKHAAKGSYKRWNEILNIKPCIDQISGTWELLMYEYGRISMVTARAIKTLH